MKPKKDGIYCQYIKRLLDILLSFTAIIVLSPIILILIVVGSFEMNGNPFFTQKRPGKIDKSTGKERIFTLIKFRTMTNRRDKTGKLLPDKDRLTRYGRFLRASSLDELGELINILIGDMSIVGPRPLALEYLPYYSDKERHRHDVLPGLTGLAQVHGRNSISWEDKFGFDLQYIENVTLFEDIKIVVLTVLKVLKSDDICQGDKIPMSLNIERASTLNDGFKGDCLN